MIKAGNRKQKRLFHSLRAAIFCGFVILIVAACTVVTRPIASSIESWPGYLELPKNSLDVLFVGNSHVECTIAPMQIWQASGARTWTIKSQGANTRHKLAVVQEALRTQMPKVLALEIFDLKQNTFNGFGQNRLAYRFMPSGFAKFRGALTTAKPKQFEQLIFPITDSHKNWNILARDNLKSFVPSIDSTFTGGSRILSIEPEEVEVWNKATSRNLDLTVINKNIQFVREIADLCRDRGIILQIFLSPVKDENMIAPYEYAQSELEDEYPEIEFLNMNDYAEEIGLEESDFRDPGHLYLWGMKKATSWWTEEVLPNWDIPVKRDDPNSDWWNRNAQQWELSTQIFKPQ